MFELIEQIVYADTQSIDFREIYKLGKDKIKIEIKSDSYSFQCHARAYVLRDKKWELIYSIPHTEMKTPAGLISGFVYKSNPEKAEPQFELDAARLRKHINNILN